MSKRSQAKIVTRTYGTDAEHAVRVTTNARVDGATSEANGISVVGGILPMRAKLPSSMEPAKHDIDVPELPALSQMAQVSELGGDVGGALAGALGNAVPVPSDSETSGLAVDSGIHLSPDLAPDTDVTLVVYAWHNVQPGVLSWIFPTVRAALSAAYAMRNAVHWAIVRGRAHAEDLDIARLTGDVLIENT